MANILIFNICLVLMLSRVESCFIPKSLYIIVPDTIPTGYKIATVEVADCDTETMHLTLEDRRFTITSNRAIVAVTPVSVAAGGRTFSVWARDNSGLESEMVVHLVHSAIREKKSTGFLKPSRILCIPPFNILENGVGPFPKDFEKMDRFLSDSDAKHQVYYTISGRGVNQNPVGLFSLNPQSGMLTVNGPIDREEFPWFILTIKVFDRLTNMETNLPLDMHVVVDDVNDNAPTFVNQLQFTVPEQSVAGTVVGKVNATDRDLAGSLHTKIKYFLTTGLDLFAINSETGVITTANNTLDREAKDKHMVTVVIRDMDGAVNGLSTTGTATITVGDINDNNNTVSLPTRQMSDGRTPGVKFQ